MTSKPHFFKLGLFVVLAFALTAAMLIAFGAGQFFKKEFLAETCFDESVQGLDIGSEVKYKGIRIGTVKAITTPSKVYGVPSSYVLVIISLAEDCYVGQTGDTAGDRFKKGVEDGLSVALSFKGITGAAYLETDYQGTRPSPLFIPWAPENLYVPSRRSRIKRVGDALNQLLESFTEINVRGLSKDLDQLVRSVNDKVSALDTAKVSDQAETLLKELRTTNDKIGRFLESKRFSGMVTDAGQSLSDLKTLLQNAKAPMDKSLANIEAASSDFREMARDLSSDKRLSALIESLDQTAQMLENMVRLNADTVRQAVRNFEYTSENLNQLTLELKKYPGRLLLERPPGPDASQKGAKDE